MRRIDLVADVGESFGAYTLGDDEALLDLLTSANVACGFHAGDPLVLDRTVRACKERGVAVGAHPGFHDLIGFGRRTIEMTADEVRTDTLYQLGAILGFTRAHSVPLTHVTPHGKLGNLCVSDAGYAEGVLDAVEAFDPTLPVVTQAGQLADQARQRGIPVAITAIADRAYNADGSLVNRRLPGAVLHGTEAIVERVLDMVINQQVTTIDGARIDLECHTVLLHGDGPDAVPMARLIREALLANGVTLAPMRAVLGLDS